MKTKLFPNWIVSVNIINFDSFAWNQGKGCEKSLFQGCPSPDWICFSQVSVEIKDAAVPSALTLTFPKQLGKFTEEKSTKSIKGKGTSWCHQQTPEPQAVGIWKSIALCSLGFYAPTLANSGCACPFGLIQCRHLCSSKDFQLLWPLGSSGQIF